MTHTQQRCSHCGFVGTRDEKFAHMEEKHSICPSCQWFVKGSVWCKAGYEAPVWAVPYWVVYSCPQHEPRVK